MSKPIWPEEMPYISRYGGKALCTFTKPYVRYFPHPKGKRRHVEVRISTYRGISPGAMHYYVFFDEEANPLWHNKDKAWVIPCNDAETFKGGSTFDRELLCATYKEAKKRAEAVVKEHYKGWDVEWNESWAAMKKWAYRVGD